MQASEKYARSQAGFFHHKDNYQRLLEASQTPGAISPMDLSTLRSKEIADSALSNAEKSQLADAGNDDGLFAGDRALHGVITQRNVHPGALVSAASKDKPMLELKEVAHLRLQVDIPESLAVDLRDKDSLLFSERDARQENHRSHQPQSR